MRAAKVRPVCAVLSYPGPATIVAEWVKGHYTGEHREHKDDLNERVDKLATNFNAHPPPTLKQMQMLCPLPGYAI
jgi:hypothetical protein